MSCNDALILKGCKFEETRPQDILISRDQIYDQILQYIIRKFKCSTPIKYTIIIFNHTFQRSVTLISKVLTK